MLGGLEIEVGAEIARRVLDAVIPGDLEIALDRRLFRVGALVLAVTQDDGG
jgi:hypothetical protein